jgi:multiple sugar transport system substrate-binding protein
MPDRAAAAARLSRRSVLAAGTGLALAGCTASGAVASLREPGQKIALTFWSWVPGIDKPVDLWNRLHPDVQIELETVSAANGAQYAKMHAALKAGDPPDLAQIEFEMVPGFLIDQGLVDLAEYGAARHRSKFADWLWTQNVYGDAVYAIPQDSGPMVMFWRKDLFDRWGVEAPTTWDEFEAAARTIRREGAWITAFSPVDGSWLTSMAWQAGARWFGERDGSWTVRMDDQATLRFADYWERLVRDRLVKVGTTFQSGWYADVQSGSVATVVGGSWADALLAGNAPKSSGDWRVALLPQWDKGGTASANRGGSTTAVFTGCRSPRDALDFAIWLNSAPESVRLLVSGGIGYPAAASKPGRADLETRSAFFGGQHYSEVVAASGDAVDRNWRWGPATDTLGQRLADAFTDAVASRTPFRAAVRKVQRQTVADLRDRGIPVESA